MRYIFVLLIIIAIVIITYIIYYIYNNNIIFSIPDDINIKIITEKYENNDNIYFMTYKETADFFTKDNDMYVRNMSDLDLHARKVKTYIEYINNIEDTAISFTDEEKELLIKCAKNADIYLRKETFKDLDYAKYINGNNIADIKWVFANTYTNRFNNILKENEEGLPHTRENIIFLSKNVLKYDELALTNTLIHEKIHIYQRYNSSIFDKIIKEMGLNILDKKTYKYTKYIRSNPDTNNNIYYKGDNVMVCLYRNEKPNSINDVVHNNYATEHPYEKIAYEIAENFYKYNKNKYINI
jgi:hypothetical protein